jgi:hypothetical protein
MDRQELVIEDDSSVDSDSPRGSHRSKKPISQPTPSKPLPDPVLPSNGTIPPHKPAPQATPRRVTAGPVQTSYSSSIRRQILPTKSLLPKTHRKQLRPLPLTTRRKLRPSLSLDVDRSRGGEQCVLRKQFQTSFPIGEISIPAYDSTMDKHLQDWRTRKHLNLAPRRGTSDSNRVKLPPIRQKSTPGMQKNSEKPTKRSKNSTILS